MSDNAKPKRVKDLNALLIDEYGLNVHPSIESGAKAVTASISQILSNNPNRVGLTFINLGANNAYIYIDSTPSASKGIFIAANGGSLALNWRDDMTLISNDWYAVSPSGATTLQVVSMETL